MTMHEKDLLPRLTRRELLRAFGGTAGLAAALALRTDADLFAASFQRTSGAGLRFPEGAVIRTLLKDVPPEDLASGVTLFHEHLSINLASIGAGGRGRNGGPPAPAITDDFELMVGLVKQAASDGVGCIVDGGHPDMGRKIEDLRTIATRTNVHVVASGGYYMHRTYPADIVSQSENEIADALVHETREQRLGAFGEIGEHPDGAELTLEERKVFRAVGKAQARTGIPVFTHNSHGTGPHVPKDIGLQQLDLLESAGASPT